MVLEELSKSDSMSLDMLLDFVQQNINLARPAEVNVPWLIS